VPIIPKRQTSDIFACLAHRLLLPSETDYIADAIGFSTDPRQRPEPSPFKDVRLTNGSEAAAIRSHF